ncbi:Xylose isomerase [[Clostridium] cellulosi]|uniref:Xylose isomerase n=1 Tax=[Clostridium] cellulosi TaxID=29343 RepID=A0A078KPR4_9FIRM|nr:Xylose isomerase [[Clostridium] cellulosi]
MKEYFSNIPKVRYEGPDSKNPFAFKFYNPEEKIAGKTMREQLKFSLAYWHTLDAEGTDMFGRATMDKSFGETDPMAIYKNKAYAAFELMDKLDIDYFCFHDRDIAPEGPTLSETNKNLDEIVSLLKKLMAEHNKKLLWGTANTFSHPRYVHGAGTSCNASVFAFAAAQIKKAIEITKELDGCGYVFWGGREGYETLLNTDMELELDNMARLLKMAVDYARSIGFKGEFFIEPKPKEPTKHQYDYDVSTVLAFLRKYGLDKVFKVNIEANHATLAQHTFQHELRVARINGVLGSVDANQGDVMLGWDTDQFPTNVYDTALAMYEILKNGGLPSGGLNFDSKNRRGSFEPEDIFHGFIAGMDAFALGLRIADRIIRDGRLEQFVKDRYKSYQSGIGADIVSGRAKIEDLEKYALKLGEVNAIGSGRQEYLEDILNSIMFGK